MLRGLNRLDIDTTTYRLANPPRVRAALTDLSISLEATLETIDFLGASAADDAGALLSSPFEHDPNFIRPPTRFSDGSWPVFYSAIEPETAEKERAHWCRRMMLCPSARRPTGTTVPVFVVHVLSEPSLAGIVVIEINVSGEIRIARSH
jgi:hypothetical protein